MAKRHLMVDRTELVAQQLGNNYWRAEIDRQAMRDKNVMTYYHNQSWRTVPVKAEEIRRITVMPVRTKVLRIFSFADEKIVIERFDGQQLFFLRSQEGKFFDEYRRELERFARENSITFSDVTG